MEKIKDIVQRLKKNPETIHIKGYRFLKRKILSRLSEKEPKLENVTLNQTHLLEEISIIGIEKEASHILKGDYEILGKLYHLEKIDWHKDFNSGKVWEKKHWTNIKYDQPGDNTDKKIPWELSKCQHFLKLGLAYQATKEKKYFEEYKKQFLDWIKENPYKTGINWVTPMECAIRAINWIEAYHLFKEESDNELNKILIKQLYLHGKYIRNNLEWSPAKENHYLSDCMGLFFIGSTLEKNKDAKKWKIFAKKELEKEILKQVSEDGVNYEASLNYHRFVTEILLLCALLGEKTQNQFSEAYKKRLENMCEFVMYYTTPTGKAPSIGDTDNGRILDIWDKDINDHRDILICASVFFKRGDFKAKGKYHEKMDLLVKKEDYTKIETTNKELTSKAFTDYYIIRDDNLFIFIHCGNIGRKGFGGHGHNDQLSFVLSTKTKDYIIDPGTYCYTSDRKMRHYFRSTQSHNTLFLNNKEQNPIKEETPFNMENKTKATCFQWQTGKDHDIFIGKHQGYIPNIVTREILYDKRKKEIIITERLKEDTKMKLNITFDPSVNIKQEGKKIKLNDELEINCEEIPLLTKTPFSKKYGHLSETNKIILKKEGNNLVTKISLKQKK